jgi:dTDP-4-dehydrorhamnose reductase
MIGRASSSTDMHVLILGSGGQVGFELMHAAWPKGTGLRGLSRSDLDITDRRKVDATIRNAGCDLVVNAAAYTAVDRAESEADAAFAVNRDGVGHIASTCASAGIACIHLSTDYVFNGRKSEPYAELDPIDPINVYGASKAAGEAELQRRLEQHIILRTSWVYGVHGSNFVKTMLRLGATRDELAIVDDQTGCPTAAFSIAAVVARIAGELQHEQARWGTYHYCDREPTTWYGFAQRIFEIEASAGRKVPSLRPISTVEYRSAARRPANSSLDCGRIEATFGIRRPTWRESLAQVMAELARVTN